MVQRQSGQIVRPHLEKTHHKNRTGEIVQGEGPQFKPQFSPTLANFLKILPEMFYVYVSISWKTAIALMCPGCAQKKNELHLLRQTVGKASA
jgi:hypothetical protein